MKYLKKTVSLSLDHDVVEGIKVLAEESDRSFSQYVNMVLKRILKNKEGLFCVIIIIYRQMRQNTGRGREQHGQNYS